jgi:predicted O-methyltransferase YrrM
MAVTGASYQLLDMLTQYQAPAILMAAHRLGIFAALGAGPATLPDLSGKLDLPERSLGILLRGAAALGLLTYEEGRFANAPLAAETLVPGTPGHIGRLVDKEAFFYRAWSRLEDCVRTDTAAIAPLQARARSEPETTRNFLLALDDIAALYGGGFVPALDLAGTRRLLDVGGGVGSYAIGLARAYPELRATVLELPEVVPWAREFITAAGLAGRIDVVAGDFLTGEFPAGYDTILFSNIFHDQPTAVNQGLLAKAYRVLPAGGRVVVYEFLLEEDRVTPPASALFAVMMLVENQGGNAYTGGEIRSWLTGAGFSDTTVVRLPAPSPMGLVCGCKPAA